MLSGDSLIIRGQPRGGPPEEKQIGLCWIVTPKMGRRQGFREEVPEELGAFEAREFLRKKLVGKEVIFKYMYSVPLNSGGSRDFGLVFLDNENGQSIGEMLVEEGLAEVSKRKQNEDNPIYKHLLDLEEKAKDAKKGKWATLGGDKKPFAKRILHHEVSQETADYLRDKTFKDGAIVEYVQNADQMKIALLLNKETNEWQMITLKLSGIKCRSQGQPFAEESKFIVESRLLQRDVTVRIEQMQRTGDNPILFGTVLGGKDKMSNIAVALLKEGMATLVDATLKLTPSPELYRAAVAEAKSKRLRIWKDYQEDEKSEMISRSRETYEAKVVEIINGDALNIVSLKDNQLRKVFLASIRPPRRVETSSDQKGRQLYDAPYMFEAREFLRKRLIGKKVQVIVDYIQPKTEQYPEKICATILLNGLNIGEALVAKGFATVAKYRADEEKKATSYDSLLDAEIKAEKNKKGLHGKEGTIKRVVELSNDIAKAKSFLPFLVRSGSGGPRKEGIVERVYSSTRIKVFIPKENCLINLIIQGVTAPKANENPYGKEGYELVKSLLHQRDVQLTIETMDKAGNFIGLCFFELEPGIYKSISLTLIEEGLASIRDTRDQNMIKAEEIAKQEKKGIWKDWKPKMGDEDGEDYDDENDDLKKDDDDKEGDGDKLDEKGDKKLKKKSDKSKDLENRDRVVITEVSADMSSFWVQNSEQGKALENLINELRDDMDANPPLPGVYTPKKGDVVAAKFSVDNEWYRGKVDKVNPQTKESEILFIDYGNREIVPFKDLAPLPASKYSIQVFPAAAQSYRPAFVYLPLNDYEAVQDAKEAFEVSIQGKELLMKKEYRENIAGNWADFVTLIDKDTKQDVLMNLVKDGYFMVKDRRKKNKILTEYKNAQEIAKKKRVSWYLDII